MENLSKNDVITQESKHWLLAALDPYHDTEFPVPSGMPDGTTARSVVRCINKSITVSAPTSIPVGGEWNLVLSNSQILDRNTMRLTKGGNQYWRDNNTLIEYDGAAEGYAAGAVVNDFINIDSYGPATVDWSELNRSSVLENNGFSLQESVSTGIGRLIGAGIECHNVTPELYRSGTVTVGELPQAEADPFGFNQQYHQTLVVSGGGGGTLGVYTGTSSTVRALNCRPVDLDAAMLYPGTRQWEAKDGLYMVLHQQDLENRPSQPSYTYPVFFNQTVPEQVTVNNNEAWMVTPSQPDLKNSLVRTGRAPVKWAPFTSKFAIFTGLSHETKLTFNLRMFYETFPSATDSDILSLATPSPDFDPHALELYQHALTHLPIGVPVGYNGLGDWFARAVSEFADVAGLGLSALGVPFASQIASGSKALADKYIKSEAAKKVAAGKTTSAIVKTEAQRKKKKEAAKRQGGVTSPNMKK